MFVFVLEVVVFIVAALFMCCKSSTPRMVKNDKVKQELGSDRIENSA
jgi:hypothetical protein